MNVVYEMNPKRNTLRTQTVKDAFGIDFEVGTKTIADNMEIGLQPGDIVYAMGSSGSGKTSICREIARQIDATNLDDVNVDPNVPLVDAFPKAMTLEEILGALSLFGLAEAHVALRAFNELSQGQRYRALMAYAAVTEKHIFADEFCAKLDRITAKAVSYNLRKRQARGSEQIWVLATTHRDIERDLQANITIDLDAGEVKKKNHQGEPLVLVATLPLPTRPVRIGRISLGGIT